MSNLVTWSPTTKGTGVILSNNDLTASHYWSYQSVKTNQSKNSGKWYLELRIDTYFNFTMIGIIDDSLSVLSNTIRTNSKFYALTRATNSTLYTYNGATIINTVNGQLPLNSVIGILLDMDLGKVDFYIDGVYTTSILNIKDNIQDANIVMTTQSSEDNIKPKVTANFGASNFLYTPSNLPSGVKSYDGTQTVSPFNKTLILHNDEYKKFESGSEEEYEISLINAVPKMTSNTTPSGLAFSETTYSDSDLPWKAFNQIDDDVGYASTTSPTNGFIGYKFTNPINIGKYAIRSGKVSGLLNRLPSDWVLEGSNNTTDGKDGNWVVLDTQSNQTWNTINTDKEFEIPISDLFLAYRIRWSKNALGSNYTTINEIKLFEKIKVSESTQSSWKMVSNVLPTSQQFIDKGMDSLSPLLDRKVMQLEPQEMTLDSTFVGEGRVYLKKVNLNKYFDIRTISTETRNS